MPKLEKVAVTFGLTVNLGAYNSARLESSVQYIASEGETYDQVFQQGLRDCYTHVREQAVALYARRNEDVFKILEALPAEVKHEIER
jgi:hypothetical protein